MSQPFPRPLSIRGKLTLAALAPLIVVLILVTVAIVYLINAYIVGDTQKRVQNEMDSARAVYLRELERIRDVVRFTAHSEATSRSLSQGQRTQLLDELEAIERREQLDILGISDPLGQTQHPGQQSEVFSKFMKKSLYQGSFAGTALLSAEQMQTLSPGLARKARLALIDGEKPSDAFETRGLFLISVAPVRDKSGNVLGFLYGGKLLNKHLSLVDEIQRIIYGEEKFNGIERGSATIFLDDRRIATTIRLDDGSRALGTQVSPQVAKAVLVEKQSWLGRARVIDEWYLTAYEPILDIDGQPIGALYVGLLEKPFMALKARVAAILFGLLLLGSGLGYLLAREISRHLSRPILALDTMAQRVAEGEKHLQLPATSRDEIGHLTRTFNHMAAALHERETQLNILNQQLEVKVRERTSQLEERNRELISTRDELLRSEKLAAVGSLAAGVAHEINNPAAIIRGNVEILLMELPAGTEGREEAEEILKQTERISRITQNMLTFAREQAIHPRPVDVNRLLDEIVAQVSHQVTLGTIEIVRRFGADLPPLITDEERLRQVFTNLLLNALQAMAGAGVLTLETRLENNAMEVTVQDTGPGIPENIRSAIFNPFFTSKKHGTGLGLSTAYGIVQSMGGKIEVESREGEGSLFRVKLPQKE
ncbi:cache domain-containing protein [Desulfuromonas sp. AOP6]|uniref:sensor histidine kinase n=1 Tax=Desulfuromonas sp. AOP6 TaxID=1566351 RepID=UPI00126CBD45|nr:cache domain-containing protein [Desulfuromonas sp. AOP6]BCA79328.1 two-component sensor histidine kinase [Desulfuromonas sp. AOP6]